MFDLQPPCVAFPKSPVLVYTPFLPLPFAAFTADNSPSFLQCEPFISVFTPCDLSSRCPIDIFPISGSISHNVGLSRQQQQRKRRSSPLRSHRSVQIMLFKRRLLCEQRSLRHEWQVYSLLYQRMPGRGLERSILSNTMLQW